MFWLLTRKPNSRPNLSLVIERIVSASASRSVMVVIDGDVTRRATVPTPSIH